MSVQAKVCSLSPLLQSAVTPFLCHPTPLFLLVQEGRKRDCTCRHNPACNVINKVHPTFSSLPSVPFAAIFPVFFSPTTAMFYFPRQELRSQIFSLLLLAPCEDHGNRILMLYLFYNSFPISFFRLSDMIHSATFSPRRRHGPLPSNNATPGPAPLPRPGHR